MNQFYISIIFIGIILIVTSFIWILFDRKNSFDYIERMEQKKKEIEKIIEDAEEMIVEMNKFSDYIVAQLDTKGEELSNRLKEIDKAKIYDADTPDHEKISAVSDKNYSAFDKGTINNDIAIKSETESNITQKNVTVSNAMQNNQIESNAMQNNQIESNGTEEDEKESSATQNITTAIDLKHKEIRRLADSGLDNTAIAKMMNMGKGEIQLILELNR